MMKNRERYYASVKERDTTYYLAMAVKAGLRIVCARIRRAGLVLNEFRA